MTDSTPRPALADPWPAPSPGRPVEALVTLPGSKSLTNRGLVLAALAEGPSLLRGALRSRDTLLMAEALRTLGTVVTTDSDDWGVTPGPLRGGGRVDCGLAGTVMRFVPPLAGLADGAVGFDGDPHARTRPMAGILSALRALGVEVEDGGRGALPFTINGRGHVRGGPVEIDASASSQFVSALLLSGPRYDDGVDVRHTGERVPSLPHLEMTVEALRRHGVQVDTVGSHRWVVHPGPVHGLDTTIEPDLSNAAPFLAAGALSGSVTVARWPERTTQAGDELRSILERMGAEVTLDDRGLTVAGDGELRGIEIDLHDLGELTPAIAALASLARTPSRLTGIGHIRGHETDRLAALARELTRLGGDVTELPDGLEIRPRPMHGGVFRTYADHRMAHAAVIVGLVVPGVEVENVGTTAKTFPDFPAAWSRLVEA